MSEKDTKTKGYAHFRLRLPVFVKESVEEAARRNGRSINAEVVARLAMHETPPWSSRDYIAAQALTGILGREGGEDKWADLINDVRLAYRYADVMLKERGIR